MTPTFLRVATAASMMTLMASLRLAAQGAEATYDEPRLVYAVPVRCGFGGTSINIHNPHGKTVVFTERGIPLEVGPIPAAPNDKQQVSLKANWAFLLGCDEILALGGAGLTGFGNIIIDSKQELDVWAVYVDLVAGGGIGGTRMERIQPTTRRR
jgi:hypothetical protein